MGDKWLNTYLFKERNGMNTDKELAEAIETVFEKTKQIASQPPQPDPLPGISPIPLAACRQIYPHCLRAFQIFLADFKKFIEKPDDDAAKKAMYDTFAPYNKLACFLSDKMYDYADWAEEYRYEEIPEEPFLRLWERKENSFTDNMIKAVTLAETTYSLMPDAFEDADRTKFMTLATLLMGSAYDIFSLIRWEKLEES